MDHNVPNTKKNPEDKKRVEKSTEGISNSLTKTRQREIDNS